LSAFYLDVRKDRLYCERADGAERRAVQTTLHAIVDVLVRLMAPVLSFTAEDVWAHVPGRRRPESVFLAGFSAGRGGGHGPACAAGTCARCELIRTIRRSAPGARPWSREPRPRFEGTACRAGGARRRARGSGDEGRRRADARAARDDCADALLRSLLRAQHRSGLRRARGRPGRRTPSALPHRDRGGERGGGLLPA